MNLIPSRFHRVLIIVAAIVIVVCSWYPPIQNIANAQVDAGLKRALISFASARTLNAVISVVQGTEFSMQPLGVGVTLTIGQVLDPINDLVEQFSSVMLVASVAFGVQKALLLIGAHWLISTLVSGFAVAWAVLYHLQKSPNWLSSVMLVLVMIRFTIPMVTIGSDLIFQQLMAKDYQEQQSRLDVTTREIAKATPQTAANGTDPTWWEKIQEKFKSGLPSLNTSFASIKAAAEGVAESIVKLIVIFLAQTIIIPIVLLWGMYRIVLSAVRPTSPHM